MQCSQRLYNVENAYDIIVTGKKNKIKIAYREWI